MQNLVAAEMGDGPYCASVANLDDGETKSPWNNSTITGVVTYNKDGDNKGYIAYITDGERTWKVEKDTTRKTVVKSGVSIPTCPDNEKIS